MSELLADFSDSFRALFRKTDGRGGQDGPCRGRRECAWRTFRESWGAGREVEPAFLGMSLSRGTALRLEHVGGNSRSVFPELAL